MFHPYRREAQFLVEEGAAIEAVDAALYEFGMAMGPLATADLAGLDIGWRIRKEYRHLEKAWRTAADRGRPAVRDGALRTEKPEQAGTNMTRIAARLLIPKSPRWSVSGQRAQTSRNARFHRPKLWIAAFMRW